MKARRIPTKQELLQLQKLYRTDKKIGQALGDVPEQLVAYWRRKKGIGKSVFPKYGFMEIKELWERFGDDSKAGTELGITKQAFYRWRKKYKLLERPTILRLEQLELKFFDEQRLNSVGERELPAQTLVQKIAAFKTGERHVRVNQRLSAAVDFALSCDHRGWTITPFAKKLASKSSGAVPSCFESLVEAFENGFFRPGQMIISNSYAAAAYGAICSYVDIDPNRNLGDLEDSSLELEVPPTLKVSLMSSANPRQSLFDLAVAIVPSLEKFKAQSFLIELSGIGIEKLTLEDRMQLCTYARLLTKRCSIIGPDQTLLNFLGHYGSKEAPVPFSDKNAPLLDDISVSVPKSKPTIFSLNESIIVTNPQELSEGKLKRIRVGPFVGGSLDDFRLIDLAMRSGSIKKGIELFIIPTNRYVFMEALRRRFVHHIVEAGGKVGNVGVPISSLNDDEFELTTEVSYLGGKSYLTSIQLIAQTLQTGKLPKRLTSAD